MTNNETVKLMAIMAAAWPREKLSAETNGLYLRFFSALDWRRASQATMKLIGTSTWWPTINELLDAAGVSQFERQHVILPAVRGESPIEGLLGAAQIRRLLGQPSGETAPMLGEGRE